jgi:hypothetical protein
MDGLSESFLNSVFGYKEYSRHGTEGYNSYLGNQRLNADDKNSQVRASYSTGQPYQNSKW